MEFNGYRKKDYQDFLESCLQDPVLRISLLNPSYTDIGFGKENEYYCIVVGGSTAQTDEQAQLVIYPYAGQQDVKNIMSTSLTKRPEDMSVLAGQVGLPITLSYYSAGKRELRFEHVEVSVTGSKEGQDWDVQIRYMLPQSEQDLWYSMIVYPDENFRTNTKYTVKVRFEVWYQEEFQEIVQEEWSFTSAGSAYIGEVTRMAALEYLAEAVELPVREDILDTVSEPYQDLLPSQLSEEDLALAPDRVYPLRRRACWKIPRCWTGLDIPRGNRLSYGSCGSWRSMKRPFTIRSFSIIGIPLRISTSAPRRGSPMFSERTSWD